MACKFFQMLEKRWANGARVCIGLDPLWEKIPYRNEYMPMNTVLDFNKRIIKETCDIALAYKPNYAFYCGGGGGKHHDDMQKALRRTIEFIGQAAPNTPVILDAKDGDIAATNEGYVTRAFGHFGAHALTVHSYLGMEAMRPFLEQKDKGIIVLCRTSNKGAGEFQDLPIAQESGQSARPLYQVVANNVARSWNSNGNCALVVGATYPEELREVRRIVGDLWLLVPGVGKQGGDVKKVVQYGLNRKGHGLIINSSSGIIFAENPRQVAIDLMREIERAIDDARAST